MQSKKLLMVTLIFAMVSSLIIMIKYLKNPAGLNTLIAENSSIYEFTQRIIAWKLLKYPFCVLVPRAQLASGLSANESVE